MAELNHPIEGEEYLIAVHYNNNAIVYHTAFYVGNAFLTDNSDDIRISQYYDIKKIEYWELPPSGTGTNLEA